MPYGLSTIGPPYTASLIQNSAGASAFVLVAISEESGSASSSVLNQMATLTPRRKKMIVTIYTCDKCSRVQEEPEGMWEVGIVIRGMLGSKLSNFGPAPAEKALWCYDCVVRIGLLPQKKDDPPKQDPAPTFEDMIREIIAEEIGNAA